MAVKLFVIPVRDHVAGEASLNGFLSSHTVISVRSEAIADGANSYWMISVEYVAGSVRTGSDPSGTKAAFRGKVDYRAILTDEEFAVYSQLRDVRKRFSVMESIPVYAIFTNEQLAQMVQQRCRSAADLGRIEGVGEQKLEKYSSQLLPVLLSLKPVAKVPCTTPQPPPPSRARQEAESPPNHRAQNPWVHGPQPVPIAVRRTSSPSPPGCGQCQSAGREPDTNFGHALPGCYGTHGTDGTDDHRGAMHLTDSCTSRTVFRRLAVQRITLVERGSAKLHQPVQPAPQPQIELARVRFFWNEYAMSIIMRA
jgi:hypothetical protein